MCICDTLFYARSTLKSFLTFPYHSVHSDIASYHNCMFKVFKYDRTIVNPVMTFKRRIGFTVWNIFELYDKFSIKVGRLKVWNV